MVCVVFFLFCFSGFCFFWFYFLLGIVKVVLFVNGLDFLRQSMDPVYEYERKSEIAISRVEERKPGHDEKNLAVTLTKMKRIRPFPMNSCSDVIKFVDECLKKRLGFCTSEEFTKKFGSGALVNVGNFVVEIVTFTVTTKQLVAEVHDYLAAKRVARRLRQFRNWSIEHICVDTLNYLALSESVAPGALASNIKDILEEIDREARNAAFEAGRCMCLWP